MKSNILKIVFIAWVAMWIGFFARELFVKNNIRDYKALLSRTLEGKHAYVTGDKLYAFLVDCKNRMPPSATYKITGIEEGELDCRRAIYYLYPSMRSGEPDFIIDLKQYKITKVKD